ncbi:hypothetical protein RDI58_017561 [Solanum bulbocastanum]|uniref:15-cis-phytoene synthase n=1 Tax=Solanum bulbocastanum TaxID=147425 RepID=A0AAN8Y9B1_SOLBU
MQLYPILFPDFLLIFRDMVEGMRMDLWKSKYNNSDKLYLYCYYVAGIKDELTKAGLSDEDIFARRVTDKWRIFMKKQIQRTRKFFDEAEKGVIELSSASRWPNKKVVT